MKLQRSMVAPKDEGSLFSDDVDAMLKGGRPAVFQVTRSLEDVRPSDPDFAKQLNGIHEPLARLERTICDLQGDTDDRKH